MDINSSVLDDLVEKGGVFRLGKIRSSAITELEETKRPLYEARVLHACYLIKMLPKYIVP